MDDDFYDPVSTSSSVAYSWGSPSSIRGIMLSTPYLFLGTALLALLLAFIAARFNENAPDEPSDGDKRSVWIFPYTIPIVGHWFQL
jgi:hypothetical protein